MVSNIRDTQSGASVHPQYNMLNVMYTMYVQVFKNIAEEKYPQQVKDYIVRHNVTPTRILLQQKLIADLLDGFLTGTFEREEGTPYVIKAMRDCHWENRVDWEAMTVFDMMASRGLMGYWFNAAADLFNGDDVRAQSPGQLTAIIEQMCAKATKTGEALG